jgi:hypothetical protein
MQDGPRDEETHTLLPSPQVVALQQYTPADLRDIARTTAIRSRSPHGG